MENRKILVVDDDKIIRNVYKMVLESEKFEVLTAESGEEALEILNEQSVHVIFTDLNMSEMNGMELCKRIKRSNSKVICYAITGYNSSLELPEFIEAEFDDHMTKPFEMKRLIQLARKAFVKRAAVG